MLLPFSSSSFDCKTKCQSIKVITILFYFTIINNTEPASRFVKQVALRQREIIVEIVPSFLRLRCQYLPFWFTCSRRIFHQISSVSRLLLICFSPKLKRIKLNERSDQKAVDKQEKCSLRQPFAYHILCTAFEVLSLIKSASKIVINFSPITKSLRQWTGEKLR